MLSLRTLAWLVAAAVAAACSDSAPPLPPAPEGNLPIEPRFQGLADQVEAERVQLGASGVAFLVMEGGEITFAHGFGVKHPDTGEPVDAGTLFRIGSVTKMLTAAALLQLLDTDQVRLDAPITEYIPQLAVAQPPDGAATIRVRDTLVQSSGLFDYLEIDALRDDSALHDFITGAFRTRTYLMAPAGALWNYSNPNYYLAGLALERVGGAPYREAMHDRLFEPLGMHRTTFLGADAITDGNFAFGVTAANGGRVVQAPTAYENAWARPAGYAFSTVYDLARFVRFLRAGDPAVLSDAQRLAMQRPQLSTKHRRDHSQYGYGLFVDDGFRLPGGYHAQTMVHHGGDIPGFAADVFYLPEADFAVIALANGDGAHFGRSIVHALVHHAALGLPVPEPADLAIDPATFASLAGDYLDPFNVGRIAITATPTGLTISLPDVDALGIPYDPALRPITPDVFLFTIEGYTTDFTFLRDPATGAPAYLRHRAFVAQPVHLLSAPAARPLDAAELRARLRAIHATPARTILDARDPGALTPRALDGPAR